MSAESTPTATTTGVPPVQPSPALVNALLKWPEPDRLALGRLLLDSVTDGFVSLEEVEQRDKDLIHSRIEQLVGGKAVLLDADEVFRRMDERLAEMRRP